MFFKFFNQFKTQRLITIQKCTGVPIKKINLYSEAIPVPKGELTEAFHSTKAFGITLKGEIRYAPFLPKDIFIYQSKNGLPDLKALYLPITELLGPGYSIIEEDDERVTINAANAWPDVMEYNLPYCDYVYTATEAVNEFTDEAIEDMGWMIIDFDVSYAELMDMLEEKTDITLVCVESEEPRYFSAMGYFDDLEKTRKVLFDFCQKVIKEKIENDPDYALDFLDEDQYEAAEYFKVI